MVYVTLLGSFPFFIFLSVLFWFVPKFYIFYNLIKTWTSKHFPSLIAVTTPFSEMSLFLLWTINQYFKIYQTSMRESQWLIIMCWGTNLNGSFCHAFIGNIFISIGEFLISGLVARVTFTKRVQTMCNILDPFKSFSYFTKRNCSYVTIIFSTFLTFLLIFWLFWCMYFLYNCSLYKQCRFYEHNPCDMINHLHIQYFLINILNMQ